MRLARWFRMALAAAVLSGWAEPVSSDLVVRAVNTLIAQDGQMECPIEGSVSSVRLCAATNGAAFYVAKLTGGGFVVTSTDTEIDPVIAVSSAPDLVEDSRNPLWALLVHDMALRQESVAVKSKSGVRQKSGDGSGNDYTSAAAARWARLTTSEANLRLGKNAGRNAISDVRVAPLLKTKWGQSTDASGRQCFNYYTPNGSLCGCTATACAQILRYHKFPKASVEPRTYECKVDGYSRTLTQKGGVYDWNNMPNVPGSGTTDKQRRAIGKLTYDVGLAVRSEYKRQSTSGYPYLIPNLCHEWGYAHATWYYDYDYGYNSLTKAQLKSVLIPNLDAKLHVQVSIRGSSSGHSVVADGYGYWDGSFSVHLNFGWDGNSDAWYVLPGTISAGGHVYTGIDQLCGNIYPNGPSRGGIVSGRVLSFSTSKPVSGIVVTARNNYGGVLYAITNEKGIYSFVLPITEDEGQGYDGGGKKQFSLGNVNWEYESSMAWDISLENASPTSDSESTASYPLRIYDCRNYYDRNFSVRIYTVKFDANGGSGGVVSRKCNVLGTLPTTKRTGYTFKGWFTAPDGGTEVTASTLPANNATYYAQWRANPYTVAFDANGGTGTMVPMDFAYDEPQVLRANAFVKGNAAFRGWSLRPRRRVAFADGESVKNLTAEADGIVTLYAVWDGDAVAADVGEYFKATLAELGCGVPVDGTPYTVVAKGLPAGLKLKYNAAVKDKKGKVVTKAKLTWWIEGVPTAALDYATNPPYLVITVNGEATTEPLLLEALAQHVMELGELTLGESVNTKGWLMGVGAGWSVSGLPTGLKFATKKITKKSGTKTVIVAEAYSVYGKTTKAGLFTITAKKKKGAYYETMKYRVLVTPKPVDKSRFTDSLTNITTMAYVPVEWNLTNDVSSVSGKVAKVTGLPTGLALKGQVIKGTPTKPGTYVVTFTKNVKSGKKTVAKTAQILWKVVANDAPLSLGFNTAGGVVESGTVGLRYGDLLAFTATSNATVNVSGLPSGMKLVMLDGEGGYAGAINCAPPGCEKWGFEGYTTKAGTYLVTVTATLNGNVVCQRVALVVEGLPDWAKGTFNGIVRASGTLAASGGEGSGEGNNMSVASPNGLATVTVSAAGKISGKFQELGTNWTLSAACYTARTSGSSSLPDTQQAGGSSFGSTDTFICTNVVAKYSYKVTGVVKGKKKTVTKYVERTFNITVSSAPVVSDVADVPVRGVVRMEEVRLAEDGSPHQTDDATEIEAWQNLWGTTYKAVGKALFTTKSGKKTLAYKTFAVEICTNEIGEVHYVKAGDDKTGLTYFAALSLKVTSAGAVTATMSYDTGKTKKDPKTKKTVKVIYKATCATVVLPTTAADADPFAGGAWVYFAPSAGNGFGGFAGWVLVP